MPMHNRSVVILPTQPFEGQKPGTSGLRKTVKTFQQRNYTQNFVQSILSSIGPSVEGSTLVVGGDGRFFMKDAAHIIIKMAAGNRVSRLIWSGWLHVNSSCL